MKYLARAYVWVEYQVCRAAWKVACHAIHPQVECVTINGQLYIAERVAAENTIQILQEVVHEITGGPVTASVSLVLPNGDSEHLAGDPELTPGPIFGDDGMWKL